MSSNDENEESRYLSLSRDFTQLRYGIGGLDKAAGGLKIIGKGIFNIGKFAITEALPRMIEDAERQKKNK